MCIRDSHTVTVYMKRIRAKLGEDVIKTVQLARKAGFDNISLDLMFAVPEQDMGKWVESMKKALALSPEHLSFYSLEIADGTVFGDMYRAGKLKETPVEEDRKMYHTALDMTDRAGYNHYEISNAALPGRECRHNLKYWNLSEYMGLGASAHSFIRDTRYSNISNVKMYYLSLIHI